MGAASAKTASDHSCATNDAPAAMPIASSTSPKLPPSIALLNPPATDAPSTWPAPGMAETTTFTARPATMPSSPAPRLSTSLARRSYSALSASYASRTSTTSANRLSISVS